MNTAHDDLISSIAPLDGEAMTLAAHRLDRLTKPPGSLGRLEELAIQLAGIRGRVVTAVTRPEIAIFAGDHGITAQGVSPYPSDVTRQMVATFLAGGAAINVLARSADAGLTVVDVGVRGEPIAAPPASEASAERPTARLRHARVANGTRDFSAERAMTDDEMAAAIAVGAAAVDDLVAGGADLIGLGEMGIGNTTASSAIVAALTGRPAIDVTGRGTGLDEEGIRRKAAIVDTAIARHGLVGAEPLEVLSAVGGLEIAALVGAILAGAADGTPVVLDGFITGAAALVAVRLAPAVAPRLIASHRSSEPGHRIVLDALAIRPILELDLRLGEGSGAALAIPVVRAAARIVGEMATFDEAGVTDRT